MIKKWCCWPKVVTGELIDTKLEDNEVVDVGIIEARNEDNRSKCF